MKTILFMVSNSEAGTIDISLATEQDGTKTLEFHEKGVDKARVENVARQFHELCHRRARADALRKTQEGQES